MYIILYPWTFSGFSHQSEFKLGEKLQYAWLCPWHRVHACVCVCVCVLSGTTLTSTAYLPSVIRIWMPIWLNRLASTPVSSTYSVPCMRSTLTSASTAKRWGPQHITKWKLASVSGLLTESTICSTDLYDKHFVWRVDCFVLLTVYGTVEFLPNSFSLQLFLVILFL